jgi:hypothetical protein
MKTFIFAFLTFLGLLVNGFETAARAQEPDGVIESYTARLSPADHYNSHGERLRTAAAIIRQDRANFFVYGIRDPEDQDDSFFSNKANRAALERLLERGSTTVDAEQAIVNGTPLIRVEIYRNFINVTVIGE